MNVLYIGSGKSSELIKDLDLSKYYVVALNNAYRHFEGKSLDCWIHSGDFPREWRPKDKSFIKREVTHPEYEDGVKNIIKDLDISAASPAHYVGYTMFFQGLYFLANEFHPKKISLLGFDHDYNPEKVAIWKAQGQPNPQNNFKRVGGESIKDSLDKTFEGKSPDSFYGHGTPDPLRLGEDHLLAKFKLAEAIFKQLGIELVNLSPVKSEINILRKEPITVVTPNHLGGHLNKTHIDTSTLKYLVDKFKIKSFLDVGCGPGGMVEWAVKLGLDAKGIDGDPNIKNDKVTVLKHDYTLGKEDLVDKVDLIWSVEFLEHIEPNYLPNVIDTFKKADYLFCTANEGPGHHHVNRKPVEYWIKMFERNGFKFLEEDTNRIRLNSSMPREFVRNTGMLFKRI